MYFYDLYTKFCKLLISYYKNQDEVDNIFFLLACKIFKCSRTDIRLLLINNILLSNKIISDFNHFLNKLLLNIPIQYIINESCFYGLSFFIDKRCFIPRKETEDLVALVISDYKSFKYSKLNIIDLGTGSGCIAITLKTFFINSIVYALDISNSALEICKINTVNHNTHNIHIMKDDIFCLPDFGIFFDIIISNPPYILCDEIYHMNKKVYLNEPYISLFTDKLYPYIMYKKISLFAKKKLSQIGTLYMEINPILHQNIIYFLKQIGSSKITTKKDYNNYNRIIKVNF